MKLLWYTIALLGETWQWNWCTTLQLLGFLEFHCRLPQGSEAVHCRSCIAH